VNSGEEARYRLRMAVGFYEESERNLNRAEWRACVDDAQLAVENAAKAVICCFHPAARTHEPEPELQNILTNHTMPTDVTDAISSIIVCCQTLGWEAHIRTDYGDEATRRTPWELFDEPEARSALQHAHEAVQNAKHVIEHFHPTPSSPST
jgi:HEPN domain-containing protein